MVALAACLLPRQRTVAVRVPGETPAGTDQVNNRSPVRARVVALPASACLPRASVSPQRQPRRTRATSTGWLPGPTVEGTEEICGSEVLGCLPAALAAAAVPSIPADAQRRAMPVTRTLDTNVATVRPCGGRVGVF